MAKYYGDIPCVNICGTIHVTQSGTQCLCGADWKCGFINKDRPNTRQNIIWREFKAITCDKCKDIYELN